MVVDGLEQPKVSARGAARSGVTVRARLALLDRVGREPFGPVGELVEDLADIKAPCPRSLVRSGGAEVIGTPVICSSLLERRNQELAEPLQSQPERVRCGFGQRLLHSMT